MLPKVHTRTCGEELAEARQGLALELPLVRQVESGLAWVDGGLYVKDVRSSRHAFSPCVLLVEVAEVMDVHRTGLSVVLLAPLEIQG